MRTRNSNRQTGFTLIELMIAMTILAFIAVGVYNTTAQSYKLRDSVEQDGDFYNSIRVALDVFGKDLGHLFTPIPASMPGTLGQAPTQQPNLPPQATSDFAAIPALKFWGSPINKFGVRPTRFNGESSKVSFVISSHLRLFRDTAETDFAKVQYALEEEKNPMPRTSGKALVKRENPDIFDERETTDNEVSYVILSNVKNIELKYLDGEKDQFDSNWDTSGIVHKDKYPDVVKLTIEVFPPGSQNAFKVEQLYRPELLQVN
jgi:general secretion pathway protein J